MATPTNNPVIARSLEGIVAHNVKSLLRMFNLNRDLIIGLVGDRGSGKSLGGANIVVRDGMMTIDRKRDYRNEPCWSNMRIKLNVKVGDNAAMTYGLPGGGMVSYEAGYMDKQTFLSLDSEYEGGHLFFDEFNLEYGEARRSSANVNLLTDRAIQQLRKLQCGLTYTVLNEMYVDTRIRDNTDIFIRCRDVAFNQGNLGKMKQGVAFEWDIYPMSDRVAGNGQTYSHTGKFHTVPVTMGHLWGIIDTYERQAEGKMAYTSSKDLLSEPKQLVEIEMQEDPAVVRHRQMWGFLDQALLKFYDKHQNDGDVIEIGSEELRFELGIDKRRWGMVVAKLEDLLPGFGSNGAHVSKYRKYYVPNKHYLKGGIAITPQPREAVLV